MEYVVLTTSILASLSTYHQVYRVAKNKSSNDISFPHILSVFANMITHLAYSTMIHNTMLTVTFANGSVATFVLISCSWWYHRIAHNTRNNGVQLV
jgi:uncharacterized protein with PQ loop repeat